MRESAAADLREDQVDLYQTCHRAEGGCRNTRQSAQFDVHALIH